MMCTVMYIRTCNGAKINSSLDLYDITCTGKTKPILKGPLKEPKTTENRT